MVLTSLAIFSTFDNHFEAQSKEDTVLKSSSNFEILSILNCWVSIWETSVSCGIWVAWGIFIPFKTSSKFVITDVKLPRVCSETIPSRGAPSNFAISGIVGRLVLNVPVKDALIFWASFAAWFIASFSIFWGSPTEIDITEERISSTDVSIDLTPSSIVLDIISSDCMRLSISLSSIYRGLHFCLFQRFLQHSCLDYLFLFLLL